MLSAARRRELGAFYTPPDVARRLVTIALETAPAAPLVCDPACGDGAFLLATAEALEERGLSREVIARELLWGIDVDPQAVVATRDAIADWAGVSPGDHVIAGDGLADRGWAARFDAVVGNPPFLNQLERATARGTSTRWSGAVGPYADTAFLFLLAAVELARPGGRVVLIQPQSLLAARDAAAVRELVSAHTALTAMWTCDELIFDASVRVCAPVLVRDTPPAHEVERWSGRAFAAGTPVRVSGTSTWSAALMRPDEPPAVELPGSGRLGDMATATAGFRQQFYGLAPYVVDRHDADDARFPRLVTCGAIDLGQSSWGERPIRFGGRRWDHPRVDVTAMPDGPLRRWVEDRLVPKVVLATQTKVLEPAVDHAGTWVPSTPVIAVHTAPDLVSRVAAVLVAPPVSAWAASVSAGTALAANAIKLSARQVLDIPLPDDEAAWADAASALEAGDVPAAARCMNEAYNCGCEVFTWWANRQ